ncbi:aldehyde dehydrogenase family protein [Promicromonospora panici]|uniref:aldehyde dehydrogenase family protein n=1 Tax=Promicromonospora panici TaxID=2219658 RepID=UPI00101C3867|nr:aldehyde dehydrogenase family protein [Promicromonospora panici]
MHDIVDNFIDADHAAPTGGRYQPVIDPCTGTETGRAAVSADSDIDTACEAAARAFQEWSRTSPADRSLALLRAADALDARRSELVAIETAQTGQPRDFLDDADVGPAIDVFRFFAGASRAMASPAAGEYLPGHTSYIRREPIGVCAVMTPFNYPLLMAAWKTAAALASGNTVVLKPSHNTPAAAVALARILADHLPRGAVNVVLGDRDAVSALVTHPIPRYVAVTASTPSGINIGTAALADVKQLHLGLGGKSPAIVTANADLEATASTIAQAAFANSGQDCTAASRVLAHSSVYDDTVELLRMHALSAKAGPPDDPASTLGPVATETQYERMRSALGDLRGRASLLCGGENTHGRGWFLSPAVLADIDGDDALATTEHFGPLLTVERFDNPDTLVSRLNAQPYGLAVSIHTRDHEEAMRTAAALDYGCVWINTHLPLATEMPHGGFRHSGFGKDLSTYALEEFTRVKHVMHAWG